MVSIELLASLFHGKEGINTPSLIYVHFASTMQWKINHYSKFVNIIDKMPLTK